MKNFIVIWHLIFVALLHAISPSTLFSQNISKKVQEAWISHDASGLISDDVATDVAVDKHGNVYVTGYSPDFGSGPDYFTVKYDPLGNHIWEARYNGEGNANDFAFAISVDPSGNVYVTGRSRGHQSTFDDYATVKYNSQGIQQWVARYNGLGYSGDGATALALDESGNVYVTGWSRGSGTSNDYATVKYSSTGVQQWVARYNGPGNADDAAATIAVDRAGNVYVSGRSASSNTYPHNYDYVTVKYNRVGVEQWIQRYNGTMNSDDEATSIAIDHRGNIYVTGSSNGSLFFNYYGHYATIKYSADGTQQWVAKYTGSPKSNNGAKALAIDNFGNVYVTGEGSEFNRGFDCVTIKYNNAGVEEWVARYNGQGDSDDKATALAIDYLGNVYVVAESKGKGTSNDYAVIKYNDGGVQQWIARYNGPGNADDAARAIALDRSGNIYVTGVSAGLGTYRDYATIKYSNAGVELWVTRHNGKGNSQERATDLAIDGFGNVYVCGWSEGSISSKDYVTVKYNSAGFKQWVARYDGPASLEDRAQAIAVDGVGNVYITGASESLEALHDYATIKYSSDGVEQWIARYNSPGNYRDEAVAIAVDGSGAVYVAGTMAQSKYATIKYNSDGIEQWVVIYDGQRGQDRVKAIAIDGSGNVYVTGNSEGMNTRGDYVTIKYNSEGIEQWVARYNGPGDYHDTPYALVVDSRGNVYVTGGSDGLDKYADYATIKYNSDGVEQWTVRYSGADNSSDYASALAVDVYGNVYVTGWSSSSNRRYSNDFATIKYNQEGVEQWIAHYDGPGNNDDYARAIAIDACDNVYVAGYCRDSSDASGDIAMLKYDRLGTEQWIMLYDESNNTDDDIAAMTIDRFGNIYLAGSSTGQNWSWNLFTTVKFVQNPISIKKINKGVPNTCWLSKSYQDPFHPSLAIRYGLPKAELVTLKVFDLLGQEITTLVSGIQQTGNYEVHWAPSYLSNGIYIYQIQAGDFIETRKLILLR